TSAPAISGSAAAPGCSARSSARPARMLIARRPACAALPPRCACELAHASAQVLLEEARQPPAHVDAILGLPKAVPFTRIAVALKALAEPLQFGHGDPEVGERHPPVFLSVHEKERRLETVEPLH